MKSLLSTIVRLLPISRCAEVVVDASEDDWGTFGKIKAGLKKLGGASKSILELEIVGMNRIHPTVLLSIFDLLKNRHPSVKLCVHIRTNLIDGSLIFPILADEIHIRKGAWFQYAGIEDIQRKIGEDEEGDGWKSSSSRVNTVKEPSAITDYRAMSAILGEYLPLAEFKGKRLPLQETLEEFGLNRDLARDSELTRLFKA